MTNLYEDDYPEGIADTVFDPVDVKFTPVQILLIAAGVSVTGYAILWWAIPLLRSAATAALLLASAR